VARSAHVEAAREAFKIVRSNNTRVTSKDNSDLRRFPLGHGWNHRCGRSPNSLVLRDNLRRGCESAWDTGWLLEVTSCDRDACNLNRSAPVAPALERSSCGLDFAIGFASGHWSLESREVKCASAQYDRSRDVTRLGRGENFTLIEHLPGKFNKWADALSRLMQPQTKFTIPWELRQVPRAWPHVRGDLWWETMREP
jgi:hypothetical protein